MEEPFPPDSGQREPAQGPSAEWGSSAEPPAGGGEPSSTDVDRGVGEEVDGQLVALDGEPPWGGPAGTGAAVTRGERTVPVTLLPAVAAGSFAAGAAVMTYVQRRRAVPRAAPRRRSLLRRSAAAPAAERIQIIGSRSVLLDVHLLGKGR